MTATADSRPAAAEAERAGYAAVWTSEVKHDPFIAVALAATATWVKEDLDLSMRVALVPVTAIRAKGLDVRVARFGPSANLSYAMFSGGGLGWAEAAMKRGEFAIVAAPPGTQLGNDRPSRVPALHPAPAR